VNLGRAAAVHHFSGCDSRELKSNLYAPAVCTKGGSGTDVEEGLEIGSLLPFATSHDKVVEVSEDIGISFKMGPLRGII
jgi:hypothetical protein